MQFDEHKNTQKWRKTEHKNNIFCSFFALSNSREKKKLSIRMVGKLTIFNARLPLSHPFHFVLVLSHTFEFLSFTFFIRWLYVSRTIFTVIILTFSFLVLVGSGIWMSWWILIFNTKFINFMSLGVCLFMPTWNETFISQLSSFRSTKRNIN